MENLLLSQPEYKIEESRLGIWKRFLYASGQSYAEFTSHRRMLGWPLVHYTSGPCPETGKRRVAKGIIAIGRVSCGVCAIGQAAFGLVAIGQLGLGVLFGVGQLSSGLAALGQACFGAIAVGQVAVGIVAIGQSGLGVYALAQVGFGSHVWATNHVDPAAREFFRRLLPLGR